MKGIKQIERYAVMVYIGDKWLTINDDGNPSLHHLPKTWLNKADASKVAKDFKGANVIKWEGR